MLLDIIALLILLSVMILGFRNGFLYTFLHSVGWIISLIAAFFLKAHIIKLLEKYTDIQNLFKVHIHESTINSTSSDAYSQIEYIPAVLKEPLLKGVKFAGDAAKDIIAEKTSAILYHLVIMLAVAFIIKLLISLILLLFSKRGNFCLLAGVDGFFGLLAGFMKGLIILFVLLAILVPVNGLLDLDIINSSLQSSKAVKILYENNVIMLFLKNLITLD